MAYASLDELKDRVDWELDEEEQRLAESALDDATDLAMQYGRAWPEDSTPRLVRTLVLRAAKRHVQNPNGYTTSRAGDETLQWNDSAGENAGAVYFTRDEQKLLAELAGRPAGLTSVPITAYGPMRRHRPGMVPVQGAPNSPFPYFASDCDPW